MVILSYEFAVVFSLFLCVYWLCYRSVKLQNILLIVAGLAFIYSWNLWFLISILLMWQVTQFCVLAIDYTESQLTKKISLIAGLFVLTAHLCFFKYSNFFIDEVNSLNLFSSGEGSGLTPLDIIMPLGLSFYTFQAISYLIDVYQEKMKPMPSFLALGFLSFVPTITAGPIFRAKNASAQWTHGVAVDDNILTTNKVSKDLSFKQTESRTILQPYLIIVLVCFALLKKVVLAGWLESVWVSPIFANPLQFNGVEVLLGIYAYAFQLFFDFSGYTDLAIALGLLLGFRLPENFRQPYLSTDIQDFWNRWHITLSHWIRDYLYIPLGGNRASFWRVQLNIMIAFVLSGIWHGAGWNFFIWGGIHGIAVVWLNLMKKLGYRHWLTDKSRALAIFLTFNYVCFGWVFFHSQTFEQALLILQGILHFDESTTFTMPVFVTFIAMSVGFLVYANFNNKRLFFVNLLKLLPWWLLPVVISIFVMMVFAIAPNGLPGFIYSNF